MLIVPHSLLYLSIIIVVVCFLMESSCKGWPWQICPHIACGQPPLKGTNKDRRVRTAPNLAKDINLLLQRKSPHHIDCTVMFILMKFSNQESTPESMIDVMWYPLVSQGI